jgi:hypothetical protein
MTRATLTALAAAAFAGLVGALVSPAASAGAFAGACLGGFASALGIARVQRALSDRPDRALRALVEAFLLKLALLVGGALAAQRVVAVAERADWRAFVLGFGVAAVSALLAGAYDIHCARVAARRERAA